MDGSSLCPRYVGWATRVRQYRSSPKKLPARYCSFEVAPCFVLFLCVKKSFERQPLLGRFCFIFLSSRPLTTMATPL